MDKSITMRLPAAVFAALQQRAESLSSTTTEVARQMIIDALNGNASEARILAAFSATATAIEKQASARAGALAVIIKEMSEKLTKLAPPK